MLVVRRAIGATVLVVSTWVPMACKREVPVSGVPPGQSWTYTAQIQNTQITELDVLFVVSNAPSMRDKQDLLVEAIPGMIRRLVSPGCVDESGNVSENPGTCPEGTYVEFPGYDDVRVGVISTSLGGHGSGACPSDQEGMDDRALFIPKVRRDVPDPENVGFLRFRGGGPEELEQFMSTLQAHVAAVGTRGCAAPAPLEAAYRALVDPRPPAEIVVDSEGRAGPRRSSDGVPLLDEAVITQREEFLRPTSLVSIVLVSDQDDCSLMNGGTTYENAGLGHRILDTSRPMARPTDACAHDPNDPCCFPCSQASEAPEGCDISACDGVLALPPELDRPSVRCFDQKRRFGIDVNYPVQRYVDGFTRSTVLDDHSGEAVENPLLRGAGRYAGVFRDPGHVSLTAIVGVPWQSVAQQASLEDISELELVSGYSLALPDVETDDDWISRWEVILGQPSAAPLVPPLDPFSSASIEPRQAGRTNPVSGDVIVGPDSRDPWANAINGHESDPSVVLPERYADGGPARDRLQAACLFPLHEPLPCEDDELECFCGDEPARNTAACTPPAGGPSTTTQYFGQATPAPRILHVLRDVGMTSTVASICPKNTVDGSTHPSFGFNPAVDQLIQRRGHDRAPGCLRQTLPVDDDGLASCLTVEVLPKEGYWSDPSSGDEQAADPCAIPGRSEVSETTRAAIERELHESGRCGEPTNISCQDYQLCLIDQLTGEQAEGCLADRNATDSEPPGFCYIDPEVVDSEGHFTAGGGIEGGNPILGNCPVSSRRMLRFVGEHTPRPNTLTIIVCQTESLSSSSEPGPDEWDDWLTPGESHDGTSEIPPPPETL